MKSVLITFDQAYYERIMALLDRLGCRGFTYLEKVQGRGSKTGDPHFGSHAWPSMCSAILTVVDDSKVDPLLDTLHKWICRLNSWDYVHLYGILNGRSDNCPVNK